MDRRSWLWRKKGGKAEKSFDSHLDLAFSIQGYEEPPSKIAVEQEAQQTHIEDTQLMKAISLRLEAEENVNRLTEKLSAAIEDMRTKEDLVKKQSNVAQEAVSGWEKAEAEALSLKQELEASVKERNIVEDRAMRLDGALKECMRQVRQAKDEQEHKIQELIILKTREVQKIKAELDAKQVELRQRLMEANAENSAMSKSLQERAKTIVEANEAKARAETEVKVLQVKLDEMGNEISALKYELHVLNKELQIRNEEREVSKKAADAAHKAHLENTKKIAKLDSECQRLRNLVRKRLPGPAAMAQMRIEVEALGIDIAGDGKRRRPLVSKGITSASPTDADKQQNRDATKVIEMLTERMVSMEEETKLLKEILAKRNEELQHSRQLCARTANKLSLAEDQLEIVQGTPRGSKNVDSQTEPSVASRSEDNAGGTDDEVHCAESWASALITELSHFRKGKAPHARRHSTESCNFNAIEESVEEHTFTVESDTNVSKNQQMETGSLAPGELETIKALASKEAELQVANLMCKDVSGKLSVLEEQLRSLFSDKNADISTVTKQVQELMLQGLADARQKVSKLDRVLDEMRIAVATLDDTDAEDNSQKAAGIPDDCSVDPSIASVRTIVIDRNAQDTISGATLSLVLCKLISLIDMKRNSSPAVQDSTSQVVKEGDSLEQQPVDQLPEKTRQIEKEIQCLAIVKRHCLQGKASVLEFLIRLGVVLSGLWNLDSSDLESLLMEEQKRSVEEAPVDGTGDTDPRLELDGKELNANAESQPIQIPSTSNDEHEALTRAKAELEERLGATDGELQSVRAELTETSKLVSDLKSQITDLLSAEKKVADGEVERAELQVCYDKAQMEVNKLQESVASLTSELEVQRTQCGELEQRLQKNVEQNQANNYRALADEDDARSRKEREMAVAKQKLAECQRTIVVLGKQLTALSSPPNHSPARSFDSTSMEPANDGTQVHWAVEHFTATPTMDEFPNQDASRGHHQYHRRMTVASAPHYRARNDRLRWSDPSRGCYYTTSGAPLHVPPHYAYQFLPDPASVTPAPANGRYSSPPTTDYSHGSAVAAYSAPHSAKSSPTPSPPRDRDSRSRERRKSASAVRTSLTEAMNRAAEDGSGVSGELVTQRRAGTSSGIGRLFSRSKNRH